ncbi:MAG: hypothetical protein HYV51_02740 [Parcubacteria group bacterium]|nr:hypothetical protein [Parcubacteria group bacterium]
MGISGLDGGSAAPSGRLQVFEPKIFPYLHTGKSLVFVIARNGMVWGKRLDDQSSKGDIELEVFWPREDGCFFRVFGQKVSYPYNIANYQRDAISKEQARKIELILSKKEEIQYELGTLMVQPWATNDPNYEGGHRFPQYRKMTVKPQLDFPLGDPCKIEVVDCSYMPDANCWHYESTLPFPIRYNDQLVDFEFFTEIIDHESRYNIGTLEHPANFSGAGSMSSVWKENSGSLAGSIVSIKTFIAKFSERSFDFSKSEFEDDLIFKKKLRVMYGEVDFFEYFEFDDASLILTYQKINNNLRSLSWILAVAQNKLVREMMRLASNNPYLFAPLIPKHLK